MLQLRAFNSPELPKKAERVYSKPGKSDLVGHYIDVRTGEVETIAYRLPEPKKVGKSADDRQVPSDGADGGCEGEAGGLRRCETGRVKQVERTAQCGTHK